MKYSGNSSSTATAASFLSSNRLPLSVYDPQREKVSRKKREKIPVRIENKKMKMHRKKIKRKNGKKRHLSDGRKRKTKNEIEKKERRREVNKPSRKSYGVII